MLRMLCLVGLAAAAGATLAQGFAYSVRSNADDHLYRIDLGTGVATDLGRVDLDDAEGLALNNLGRLYGIGGTVNELWSLNPPPGVRIGDSGTRNGVDAGLDWYNDVLYNLNAASNGSTLYTLNTATGTATLVGTGDFFADNLGIDDQGVAYGADWIFTDSLYRVNLATGAMTLVGSLNQGDVSLQAGADDIGGTLYNLTSDGRMWSLNKATGAATFLFNVTDASGGTLDGFEGLAGDAVPEPATLAVLAVGFLALIRRRR